MLRSVLCSVSLVVVRVAAAGDFIYADSFDAAVACPAGPTPAIGAVMSPGTRSTMLGTKNTFTIHVLSCGYSGAVALVPSGAPASWSVTLDPPGLTLASNGTASALMTATIPTTGANGSFQLDVQAQAANNVTVSSQVDAANMVMIIIPQGTGNVPHAFPQDIHLRVGTVLRVASEDTSAGHVIHADLVPGFAHQNVSGPGVTPGFPYDLTSTGLGSGNVYCHSHGPVPVPLNIIVDQL
jgi:hypothetical protein